MKATAKGPQSGSYACNSIPGLVRAGKWVLAGVLTAAVSVGAANTHAQQPAAGSKTQQYQQQIKTEKQAVKKNPKDWNAWLKMGNAYYNQGQYPQAVSAYQQSTRFAPSNSNLIWKYLGDAYGKVGKYRSALTAYQQSIAEDGNYEPAWSELGYAEGMFGNSVLEVAAEQKAVALNPKDESAWVYLANASTHTNQPAKVVHAALQAIRLDPKDIDAWDNLGWGYCMQGDVALGIQQVPMVQKLQAPKAHWAQTLQSFCAKQAAAQAGNKKTQKK